MASENNLNAVFTDIANAIRDKKGSVDTIKPINMADEILTIETGGGKSTIYSLLEAKGNNWSNAFQTNSSNPNIFYYMTELSESDIPPSNNVVNMSSMFNGCYNLTTIPLLNTSSCTDMHNMFYKCSKLTTTPQIDTSSCTNMSYMFDGCTKLVSVLQLDTSSATNMSYMFSECTNLTTIPPLDTSSATNLGVMFGYCYKLTTIPKLNTNVCENLNSTFKECYVLEKIDITKFTNGTNRNNSFAYNCYSLKILIIRTMDTIPALNSNAFDGCLHFYGTTDATYNPNGLKDGRIYVPDDKVASLKTATNWSVFADIIKPLSEYVE